MDPNLNKIAQEIYGKIQTRFPEIKMGDAHGEVLSKEEDIPEARFFEFEYIEDGQQLGTITITLDEKKGLVMQVGGDLTNDDSNYHDAYKFIRSFSKFANRHMLHFTVRNIGKSNLDKRDYQFQAKRKELPMMESKLFGTSKVSYQDLGEARLIIKHNQHINPDLPAGRTMHIESIYIQNADGERFKYPFKHLNGARALAEHIKHGGHPYDGIGKHITSLSEELAQLRKFKGFVNRQPMIAEAMGPITDRVIERMEEIKKEVQHLQRPHFYESFAESFEEREEQVIPEDIINDLVDRLTVRTFNEELKAAFPFIYKFIDESDIPVRELSADDLLSEEEKEKGKLCPVTGKRPCKCKKNESFDPLQAFESFIDSLVESDDEDPFENDALFSSNPDVQNAAIEKLNNVLAGDLVGGTSGVLNFQGIIDDPEFVGELEVLDDADEIRDRLKDYILDRDPELVPRLDFANDGEEDTSSLPEPAPAPLPAPEPMPEPAPAEPAATPLVPPVAEGSSITRAAKHSLLRSKIKRNKHHLHSEIARAKHRGLDEMLEFISGFYRKDETTNEGHFPLGPTRIKIMLTKAYKEGQFPNATDEDVKKVLMFIDKKDPSSSDQDRVLELAGVSQPTVAPVDARETKLGSLMDELNNEMFESIVKLAGIKK